jgi:hypothetical protein
MRLKAGGYTVMFLAGIAPMNGTRNPAMIVCRIFSARGWLCVLALGGLIRIGYLLGGIQLFKSLFS